MAVRLGVRAGPPVQGDDGGGAGGGRGGEPARLPAAPPAAGLREDEEEALRPRQGAQAVRPEHP